MEFFLILIPVFSIFAIGYIGQKRIGFDTKNISTMALYLMSPVLVFRTFYTTEFNQTYLYLAIYTFALCFFLILVIYLLSFFRRYSMKETCGMILASAFMNNGNYGTPVVLFVFGASGLDYAIVLMVIQQLLMSTVGVYYAAKGGEEGDGIRSALKTVRKMPIGYGALLGVSLQFLHVPINENILIAVDMVANAAIPTVMIVLGMQLAKISIRKLEREKISLSLFTKLAISPLIAFCLTLFLPVDDMVKQIMIIMAAMPTAANTTMYALQFNTEPEFVSTATLLSTILSVVTLPTLFMILL
ncbi:AEC family transporter [Bacillus weihaiensis]|uniref:Transporter n=1 Tax=Bacillus weihaiensis TaxID=1547283 RepID=A0A1L3MM71_9BACI|nr:AEC family transporter [Bacillus weihaiensis]APH03437.1 hypothetical protein A9C19_00955 [Bacillus weihaiensis]